jgi:hypothetical protein
MFPRDFVFERAVLTYTQSLHHMNVRVIFKLITPSLEVRVDGVVFLIFITVSVRYRDFRCADIDYVRTWYPSSRSSSAKQVKRSLICLHASRPPCSGEKETVDLKASLLI